MELPFYKIVVNENDETGVDFNAFVDAPAHMKGFIAFNDAVRYSFNDEKRIVTGVMISTGTPIYRRDEQMGEHYVVFDAPTVDIIRKKFFKQGYNTNSKSEDHDPNKVTQGATLIDSYIVSNSDPKLPSVPEAFEHMKLQDGSWIASYYVSDDALWNGVKEGKFNGFSVEGWFDKKQINIKHEGMQLAKGKFNQVTSITKWDVAIDQKEIKVGEKLTRTDSFDDKVIRLEQGEYMTKEGVSILVDADGVVQKMGFKDQQNKSKMKNKNKTLMERFEALRASILDHGGEEKQKFAEATTAEGVVVMYDGELAVGTQVFIEAEGEEQLPATEGDHQLTLEDGTVKLITLDGSGVVVTVEDFKEEEPAKEDSEMSEEVMSAIELMATEIKTLKESNEKFRKELKTLKEGEKFKAKPNRAAADKEENKKLTASELLKGSK